MFGIYLLVNIILNIETFYDNYKFEKQKELEFSEYSEYLRKIDIEIEKELKDFIDKTNANKIILFEFNYKYNLMATHVVPKDISYRFFDIPLSYGFCAD